MTIDQFAFGLAEIGQKKGKALTHFNTAFDILKSYASSGHFEINLANASDLEVAQKCFEIVKIEGAGGPVVVDPNALTKVEEVGGTAAIVADGYDISVLRKQIHALKGSGASALNLKATITPGTEDPENWSCGLEEFVYKGKSGQAYWTVGSTHDCDILLAKTGLALGAQFAILLKDGNYFIKDLSILTPRFETTLRIDGGKTVELRQGMVFSMGGAAVMGVNELGSNVHLEFLASLHTITTSADFGTNKVAAVADETASTPIGSEYVIGNTKKAGV